MTPAGERAGWIERVIELSIRNRAVVFLLVAAVALYGVYALKRTPVDAIPDLSENQVIVFADWPGRSPKEVEDQITYPLSVNLQGLAGVKAVRATSEFNFSMVNVIFEEDVDFYFARQRVLERLSIASTFLPEGVVPYLAPDATALGQVFWYTVEGDGQDLGELRAIQDWYVRYQLNSVPGVAQVSSVGGFVREYQVDIDPNELRAYGVTLGEVFDAVARSNSSVGGNVVEKNRSEYLIRGFGWIRDPRDIESVVVAERKGVPIYVRNLATVQVGPAPRRSALEKDGREAVGGVVLMRYGENPLEVIERVRAKIDALGPGLPEGVRIVPFYDRTRLIREALDTLRRTLIEEIVLASIVVFLVLYHFRSAFVICITLPLAVLISFIFMHHVGVTSNIMSLAGIAISIGVLVDAGIVMTENAFARLHDHFGERKVTGDTRDLVLRACKLVGRPLFFSVLIMVISFLPVFALTGIEGKMFRPFAFTKTFALIGVSVLAITLVPALIPTFVRGRLRGETDSWLVRSVVEVYRPVLLFLLDRPKWVAVNFALIVGLGLYIYPKLGRDFMPPLDEGALMDMPTTSPSVSVSQATGDLIVRDALLRSLPEVEMVVGKVGRADTPTDPAPPDMIETVVTLRPKDQWPRRALDYEVFEEEARRAVASEEDAAAIAMTAAARFDETLRELALRRLRELEPELAREPTEEGRARLVRERVRRLDWELEDRAGGVLAASLAEAARTLGVEGARFSPPADKPFLRRKKQNEVHDGKVVKEIRDELDTIARVPGWGNSWTRPIQNRVDMLATGVRSQVGVKVFGSDRLPLEQALEEVQRVSNEIAAVLREVPGAVDVFPDQATGERYLEIVIDRERAARYGVRVGDIQDTIEVALGGKQITTTVEGRRRFPVRVRYARDFREDEETVKRLLVSGPSNVQIPLSEVADVSTVEGPSMIRSENGLLRSYVQLNVKDRDLLGFVEEAKRVVASRVKLPPGMYVEWSGEFEHQVRARRTLSIVLPAVVFLIFLILYLTYQDLADASLMMLAVPGALAGGLLFQWIFGHDFTVAVWVGYIVALGLATETGIVMLVYLREAVDRRGGLERIGSLEELKAAVTEGAVHRLRPKLLTEATTILGLVPMLWATGAGAEIMRPMAAPVIGGILIADEVIDVFIPVIFYWGRRRRWLRAHPEATEADPGPSPGPGPSPSPSTSTSVIALILAIGLTGCLGAERAGPRAEADRALAALAPVPERDGPDAALDEVLAKAPTIDLVRDAAVRRNPDLRAALERFVEFLERVPQRTALPYPRLRYEYKSGPKEHMYAVEQELPFPTKLGAEGRAALALARAARAEARESENALRERADVAYAELYLARRQVELVAESIRYLERILELVRAKVEAGTAPQSDLLRIEVERDTLLAEHAGHRSDAEVAAGALNVLLDRRPEAPIGKLAPPPSPPPGPLPPATLATLEAHYAHALAHRPELEAARERTAAAGEMLARAGDEWVPDVAVGAAYVRDFGRDENEVELTVGFTVPLLSGRPGGAVAEGEAAARRAGAELRAVRNRVLEEVRTAWLHANAAAERHRLLAGRALARARETVETSETAYMAEKLDFLGLVDAQRMRLATELEAERALADYAKRSAELARATGRPRE